jgi:hypothetical protein
VPTIQITQLNSDSNYEYHKSLNLTVGTNTIEFDLLEEKNLIFSLFMKENDVVKYSNIYVGSEVISVN